MLNNLRASMSKKFFGTQKQINFTVSIGISHHDGVVDAAQFVKYSDAAMYHSKNSGRNRVSVYGEFEDFSLQGKVCIS